MKRILFALFCSLTLFKSYAQTSTDLTVQIAKSEFQAKQIIPSSRIATELVNCGSVPHSLFIGTPKMSVPL